MGAAARRKTLAAQREAELKAKAEPLKRQGKNKQWISAQ